MKIIRNTCNTMSCLFIFIYILFIYFQSLICVLTSLVHSSCVQVIDQRWRVAGHDVTHPRLTRGGRRRRGRQARDSCRRQREDEGQRQEAAGGGGGRRQEAVVGGSGLSPLSPCHRRRSTRRRRRSRRSRVRRPRTREARRRVSTSEARRRSLRFHFLRTVQCFALCRPSK